MEEEKAAAYYEELTRKGEGAARFKQGLGFSSSPAIKDDSGPPARGSYFVSATSSSSSSSFLGSFVRASSPNAASKLESQAQLESIQNKLKKKPEKENADRHRDREARVSDRSHRSRSRDRDRYKDRERHSRRRSRSRSREKYRERDRDRGRDRKRRSRSRSLSPRRRSDKRRSAEPRDRMRSERSKSDGLKERSKIANPRDYSQLIDGYDKMTPAEKVKAKMKLQLNETAEKDETNGTGSGWERFEFDKDAPLDDEDVEGAEDDAALVKHIGQSFRFSAVEARREEEIKTAHDEAMFGSSAPDPSLRKTDIQEEEGNTEEETNNDPPAAASLLNDKVLARQQGSWRDRARKTT